MASQPQRAAAVGIVIEGLARFEHEYGTVAVGLLERQLMNALEPLVRAPAMIDRRAPGCLVLVIPGGDTDDAARFLVECSLTVPRHGFFLDGKPVALAVALGTAVADDAALETTLAVRALADANAHARSGR